MSKDSPWPQNMVRVVNPATSDLTMEVKKMEEGAIARQVAEWRLTPGESLDVSLTIRQALITRMVRP